MKKISGVLCILVGILSGCGFHLRGVESFPSPMRSMMIESKYPNTPAVLNLREKLVTNGIVLTTSPSQAKTILELSDLSTSDQAISLLGAGQASTHRLTDTLTYTLREAGTMRILAGPETIQMSRNYNSNASLILSDDYIANDMSKSLQQEVASEIFDRLSRISPKVWSESSHETSSS